MIRRLWDSGEDNAEVRDRATGRFIDRDKLHYIDFHGRWFAVRGPSMTPRPPEGQPLVAALAHASRPYRRVARSADLGFVTPRDPAGARARIDEIRAEEIQAGRPAGSVHVIADLVVFLGNTPDEAESRRARFDEWAGGAYQSDASVFIVPTLPVGRPGRGLGGHRAVRLPPMPGTLPYDLTQITGTLVPELQHRRLFRPAYEASTTRGHFGLPRPSNRYAAV